MQHCQLAADCPDSKIAQGPPTLGEDCCLRAQTPVPAVPDFLPQLSALSAGEKDIVFKLDAVWGAV